jgi:hypothetical protein
MKKFSKIPEFKVNGLLPRYHCTIDHAIDDA